MSQKDREFAEEETEAMRDQASDWVAKFDRRFTAKEQDEFFEWLARDPRHGESYNPRHALWKQLNILAEWRPEHSPEPNPDLLATHFPNTLLKWTGIVSALAAVLLIGLLLSNLWPQNASPQRTLLATGDAALFYEYHVLDDGSIVELNRGAQVSVLYTTGERSISLLAGEAHFTVAKDVDRPFVVEARGTLVRAVGTAFNVSLNSEEIEVLVTEGRVQVSQSKGVQSYNPPHAESVEVRELIAGQRSHLSLRTEEPDSVVEEVSNEEIARRLAWKSEVLDFTATPLSAVVLEFNRRNHTQLVIGDPRLGNREITAALRPNNLDGFLELLELTLNVRSIPSDDDTITLSRKKAAQSD